MLGDFSANLFTAKIVALVIKLVARVPNKMPYLALLSLFRHFWGLFVGHSFFLFHSYNIFVHSELS